MKKSIIVIIGLVVLIGIIFAWYQSVRNSLVQEEENVKKAWSNVESQYQRRSDLINNLVATVKGYAEHEKGTFVDVTKARVPQATQMKIDPANLNEETLAQFQAAQNELQKDIKNYISVTVEAYPNLKANENFINLQTDLAGTENRIATERMRFTEAAQQYNTMVRQFPNNIVASISGFSVKPYFKSDPGAEKAPEVKF